MGLQVLESRQKLAASKHRHRKGLNWAKDGRGIQARHDLKLLRAAFPHSPVTYPRTSLAIMQRSLLSGSFWNLGC
jgi:hypothetical protein